MLLFDAGNTAQNIIVTLSENVTLTQPNYRFVFIHIETRQEVIMTFSYTEDQSPFEERFNHFVVDCSEAFLNKPDGMWLYSVFEVNAGDNLLAEDGLYILSEDGQNITTESGSTQNQLETGRMKLVRTRPTVFTSYTSNTSFKAYNGQ